jgi:hypothetical protein
MYDITLSLNSLAYDAFELARPTLADDETIDYRQIKFWIISQRALWLRNEFNKNRTIDDGFIQDLGCVALQDVDASQCCNVVSGCTVKRTVFEIPITIERHNSPTITSIGPVNINEKRWTLVPYSRVPFVGKGRFNKKQIYPFLYNRRIFIAFNPNNLYAKLLTTINIRGVFEDPTEVGRFSSVENCACYSDNDRFPLNRWLWEYMKAQIISGNLRYEILGKGDKNNDAQGYVNASSVPTTTSKTTEE